MKRTKLILIAAAGLLALSLGSVPAAAQSGGAAAAPQTDKAAEFTADKPENQGLSGASLQKLTEVLNRLIQENRLVGAELVVLKNRRVVLHETAGWKDRESETRMEKNTIFSLRSLTRPLIGLAAQLLIDEGRLALQDKVSRFLPAFGQGPTAGITVEHLLTQRSGLPKAAVTGFAGAASLRALAEASIPAKPAFEPGKDFLASDPGSDVLAAVVERASGLELESFVKRRLLEPLGMKDTFVFSRPDDPRANRICSAYVGTTANWNRNWSLEHGPLYRFAMGSQSFYSTPLDCARLLSLLLDKGTVRGRTLLTAAAVKRVLTPVSIIPSDTGFSGVKLRYGQMMQVLVSDADPNGEPAAFGHSNPEGILAWAWPGQDLIILFFTQTHGVRAEVPIENAVDQVLLHAGERSDVPEAYRPLLGKYIDVYGPSGAEEVSIVYLNGRLAIDIPSQAVFLLDPPDSRGRFALSRNASIGITFVRNDRGEVTGLRRDQGDKSLEIPRLGTPEAEAVLDKAQRTREGWKKYVGLYNTELAGQNVEIVMKDGSLGILREGQDAPLLLRAPDAQGRWRLNARPTAYVTFEENEKGEVMSFTFHTVNGQALVRTRIRASEKK
jgi:CubicO group peptidase (beta-lactamase class C family)